MPSTSPEASPTLTEGTWALSRVPVTSKDWVPMMTMTTVLELALTVSPAVIPTETMVPVMGLVRVASASDCSASVRCASAVSMSAWSLAICSGVVSDELAVPCATASAAAGPLPVLQVPHGGDACRRRRDDPGADGGGGARGSPSGPGSARSTAMTCRRSGGRTQGL